MKQKHLRILALLIALLCMAGVASAKGVPPYAGLNGDGQLVLYDVADTPVIVESPLTGWIQSFAWSPDGSKVAFIQSDEQFQARLLVTDTSGQNTVLLETGQLAGGLPVRFTPEGDILYVEQGEVIESPPDQFESILKTVAPEAGAQPETLGTFPLQGGCGGGSPYPADWGYHADAGFGGNALVFEWTDYGILHSLSCAGGGLALLDPATNIDQRLGNDGIEPSMGGLGRAVVSPDGTTVAAIKTVYAEPEVERSLVLVDLATGETSDVETAATPDQLAWGLDGWLYYSTRTNVGNLVDQLDLTPEQQDRLKAVVGFSGGTDDAVVVPAYEVSIHHLNPDDGTDEMLVTADAYAIGRMQAIPGEALVYSQIPNMETWVQAMADGELNPANDPGSVLQQATTPTTLYLLPPQSTEPFPLEFPVMSVEIQEAG